MLKTTPHSSRQRGDTLLEVLVTLILVAFGLLGFAGFQGRMELTNLESHQRAEANALASDMAERLRAIGHIRGDGTSAIADYANYVYGYAFGTDGNPPESCPAAFGLERDICEWSNALKGNSIRQGAATTGAMIGARACIDEVRPPNTNSGVCDPGIYQVTVVWQGLSPTAAPVHTCGQGLYGDERLRRAVTQRIVVGLPQCS